MKKKRTPTRVYLYITYSDGKEVEKEYVSRPAVKKAEDDNGLLGKVIKDNT